MKQLWKIIKWLAGTLALFGAFMLGDMLRGDPITLRHYIAAAGMAGFFGINSLPLKWSARQRFAFNFGYVSLSMLAISFYFGEPFTWIGYVFVPCAIALSMAAIFHANHLIRAAAEQEQAKQASDNQKAA